MTRRARTALGADALRGLLGAEDLGPSAAPKELPASAPPSKSREVRAPRRRRRSPSPAPATRPPASASATDAGPGPAAGDDRHTADRAQPAAPAPRPRRTNVQGYIDAQVLDRARDAAFWTPGVSLSALIEQGLRTEVARLEAERGEPFPPRRGPLARGPAVR